MEYNKLPGTNIEVSKICLGTMTWGRQNSESEAFEQMDYSLDHGVNFFDTAELYPVPATPERYADTERIIGNWLSQRNNREKIILASKIAGPRDYTAHIRKTGFKGGSIEDGRSRGREYDVAELESHSAKAAKKYWKVYDTVVKRLEKKAQKENAIFDRAAENDKHGRKGGLATIGRKRIDYMSDEHIREAMLKEGYVKTFEQRTRRKQSIRTNTHKLLNKAQANIEAVEKGTFGVGH
jgi:hypothetical protein